jgi:hypothetical protein
MTCQECQLALASEEREFLRDAVADEGAASRTAWQAACRELATEWHEGVQGLHDEYAASHLEWCAACQEFAMELRENSAALREFATEPMPALPEGTFNVAPWYRPSAWWPAAAAVVAAMLMLGFVTSWKLVTRREPNVLPEPSSQIAGSTGAQATPVGTWQATRSPAPLKAMAAPARHRAPRRSQQANESHILQVKMLTDDPDVVIYWQIEN